MKNSLKLFTPWVPPHLPSEISTIFQNIGKPIKVPKNYICHDTHNHTDTLFYVESGALSHAVINDELDKPIAISLIPQGRMTGFSNFFTHIPMPTRAQATEESVVYALEYHKLHNIIANNFELYKVFSEYKEHGNKNDLYGMLNIMTQPVEERIKMLFVSLMISYGFDFERCSPNNFATVPFRLTRQNISYVAYTSNISLDRIFAIWVKEKNLKRAGKYYQVKPSILKSAYDWIVSRS